jgi:hypothetical protein
MSNRLTGLDATVQIFKGEVLQDELTLIKECTVTAEMSVSREDYLGEKQQRPDGKFDIFKVEFTAHQEDAAYFDFINEVIKRQMREPGAIASFNMSVNVVFPGTGQARSIVLQNLEFEAIPIGITGRKEMVETSFTAYASSHIFIN